MFPSEEEIRKAWARMFLDGAMRAANSATPNSGMIALTELAQFEDAQLTNLEVEAGELKADLKKIRRKIPDLHARLLKIVMKKYSKR